MLDLIDNLAKMFVGIFLKWLFAKWPGLSWGPIGWIVTEIVLWIITNAVKNTVIGGMFIWFDWSTKRELNAVEKALKDIYDFDGVMTGEEVERYENNLSEAYWELIELRVPRLARLLDTRPAARLRGVRRFSYNWRKRVYYNNIKAA